MADDTKKEDDVQEIISRLTDNQKHELVGRMLQEKDNEQWESLFASAALQRCKERTIRFVEMSGRETKLKVAPLERLYFTQKNLAEMMPAKPPEGDLPRMRRRVQCFHGANLLREDTIAAMLPEEVNIVFSEEPEPPDEAPQSTSQVLLLGLERNHAAGEPLIAPSCFEALSLGTHVVQPRFPEPRMLKNKPITQNWTSQHPFLEQIPEPYAFTIDPLNFEALGATFRALRNAFDSVYGEADTPLTARESKAMRNFYLSGDYPGRLPDPSCALHWSEYIPYGYFKEEFSISGFLKRVAGTVTKTRTLEAADWDWERGDHPQQLPARAFQS
eukprot:symbB.v1.2.027073.t2/scaffold2751.1/size71576/2